jgi:hypothetical protein
MTILIKIPGTLTNTTGLDRVTVLNNGADSMSVAPINSVEGADAGSISSLVSSNNAFAWQAGGGLQIQGGQQVEAPFIDITAPWSLVSAGQVTASFDTTATSKNYALLGFRQAATNNFRGAQLNISGGGNWASSPLINFSQTAANGSGGLLTLANLSPAQIAGLNKLRICHMSYNGSDTLNYEIYDEFGTLMATATRSTTDATISTGLTSTVLTQLKPAFGGATSAVYCGGTRILELGAVYAGRVIDAAEIRLIAAKAAALTVARGRTP